MRYDLPPWRNRQTIWQRFELRFPKSLSHIARNRTNRYGHLVREFPRTVAWVYRTLFLIPSQRLQVSISIFDLRPVSRQHLKRLQCKAPLTSPNIAIVLRFYSLQFGIAFVRVAMPQALNRTFSIGQFQITKLSVANRVRSSWNNCHLIPIGKSRCREISISANR